MRDRDVRRAVTQWLMHTHADDDSTKIIEEMGVWSGSVRIDVAVINGELNGFELKSDKDTLERLEAQANIYNRVFDRVTLVVGTRHISKATGMIPEWWGIIGAVMQNDAVSLNCIRASCLNPSPDPYLIAQLLWKEEALSILDDFGFARGWKNKRVKEIHLKLSHDLAFDELRFHVRSRLKARSHWLRQGNCARTT